MDITSLWPWPLTQGHQFQYVRASTVSNRIVQTASKSVHPFGWNLVHWQTHTQTDRNTQTNCSENNFITPSRFRGGVIKQKKCLLKVLPVCSVSTSRGTLSNALLHLDALSHYIRRLWREIDANFLHELYNHLVLKIIEEYKKHSENAHTSTSVIYDLDVYQTDRPAAVKGMTPSWDRGE